MDKAALVDKSIDEGRRLIEALDETEFDVQAALWFYVTDADQWRLLIASRFVDKNGSKAAYRFIQPLLARLKASEISLRNTSVLSPGHQLIALLRTAIRTAPGISDIRFSQNVIGNILIEDAYIYRLL